MDNLGPLLFLAFIWLAERLIKMARRGPKAPPAPRRREDGAGGALPGGGYAGYAQLYVQRLASLDGRAAALAGRLAELDPEVAARIGTVLGAELQPAIQHATARSRALLAGRDDLAVRTLVLELQSIAGEIGALEQLLLIVDQLVEQRLDPATQAILGDTDALAEACYRPILAFAHTHDVPAQSNFPLTLLHQDTTAVHLAFLRYQLAPIALPRAIAREPWRWPAIAHEIAHDLLATVDGLAAELVQQVQMALPGGEDAATAPGAAPAGGETAAAVNSNAERVLFGAWLEEIFADAAGLLMIGPAYLRSMTAIFARPSSVTEVLLIPISPEGQVDPHPPRHLRVHWTAHLLRRMGQGRRGQALRDAWDAQHGKPQTLTIAGGNARQQVAAAPLLARGCDLVDAIYDAELQRLAGHRLADVPGLEFGSLHARRAARARPALAAGRAAAFDARSLIAAAAEAALDAPEHAAVIMQALRKSVVGIGTAERPGHVRALAIADGAAVRSPGGQPGRPLAPLRPLAPERVVDALLLYEILEQPAARGRRAPGARPPAGNPRLASGAPVC